MSHMNSLRGPAAIIFAALLVIIMLSASRVTYTLAPAPDTLASCAAPHERDAGRLACARPRAAQAGE